MPHRPTDATVRRLAEGAVADLGARSVPIVAPDAVMALTEGQAAQADVRKRCALALLEREAPLIPGESILDDQFSYLSAPYAGLRSGTAVLRRTTNYAELIFLFDDIRVAGGDLIHHRHHQRSIERDARLAWQYVTDAVQTLMLPEFKLPGFSAFMLSAGVHLALFQEQALVDPTVTDPNRSSFAETVRLNARIYADHAAAVQAEIVAQRSRAITLDFVPEIVCAGARCWAVKGYRWDDAHTGKFGQRHGQYTDKDKKYHDGSGEALADLKRYRAGVLGAMDATLDKPAQTIALWRRLIDQPETEVQKTFRVQIWARTRASASLKVGRGL